MKKTIIIFTLFALSFFSNIIQAQINNTLLLNGSNDYLEVPNNSTLDFIDEITVEAWVYISCESEDGYSAIVNKQWCQGQNFAFSLETKDGDLKWAWLGGEVISCAMPNVFIKENAIQDNEWTHIAVTHTPNSVQFYINGEAVSGYLSEGQYSSIHVSDEPIKIGAYRLLNGNLTRYLRGALDEVRLWDYARSDSEISSAFNSALTGNESGLSLYFNMEEQVVGSESIVENLAQNTGAINNAEVKGGSADTPITLLFEDVDVDNCINDPEPEVEPDPVIGVISDLPTTISITDAFVFDNIKFVPVKGIREIKSLNIFDFYGNKIIETEKQYLNCIEISILQNLRGGIYIYHLEFIDEDGNQKVRRGKYLTK